DDERAQRVLVCIVWREPARTTLRLARGLRHVRDETLGERIVRAAQGTCAERGLEEEVLIAERRRRLVVDRADVVAREIHPLAHPSVPLVRDLGESGEPSAKLGDR